MEIYQSWRENELNALLKDLRDSDIGAPEPTLEQAAELQRKWNTKLGQIWLAFRNGMRVNLAVWPNLVSSSVLPPKTFTSSSTLR
jgi:hypothetical protein